MTLDCRREPNPSSDIPWWFGDISLVQDFFLVVTFCLLTLPPETKILSLSFFSPLPRVLHSRISIGASDPLLELRFMKKPVNPVVRLLGSATGSPNFDFH